MAYCANAIARRSMCAVAALLSSNAGACGMPDNVQPASTVHERQPTLSWSAVPGATSYRVKLRSRVPNGRDIATYDSVVKGASFVPPQALAADRAKVAVGVTAMCGTEVGPVKTYSFMIDTRNKCVLGPVNATWTGGMAGLTWAPVSGAKSYQVRAFAEDGAFLGAQQVRKEAAKIALKAPGARTGNRDRSCQGRPEHPELLRLLALWRNSGARG